MTDNDRATRRIRTGPPAPAGPPQLLGTPLSPSATKVMLLGSGELGKEVIIAFQRLGVEVVAVDRYADAPGHQVAHHSEVIDMTDPVQVREVIERHRPQFVVPEIEAIATEALAEVERDGLAEVIPTAHAVVATMNRESIRRLADEKLGLPTSPYRFAESEDELATAAGKIGFPCVVKPVMSSSGHGQSVLHSPNDVAEAWRIATTGGRVATTRVIVEGFIEFDYEITLLTVRSMDPATGRLTIQFCEPIGHRQIAGDYVESWQPQEMNADAFDSARSVAARIVTAMGQGDLGGRGVFGVELFVKGADVYFSEVSPRPHDTGLVTMATQRLSEFEMHARAILGLPVDITLASPGASAVIYGRHEAKAIAFANVAAALQVPETDIRLFGKPEAHPRRRMGVVTATADTVDEARRRATAAASRVQPVVPSPAPAPAPPPVAGEGAPRNPAPQNPEPQNPAPQNPAPQATAVPSRPQAAADVGQISAEPAPEAQPDPGVHTEVVRRPSGPTAIKPSELDPERSPRS